ncbi:MAG TPA: hypothetical protein VFU35_02555, partial [Jatrophihabitans sp.]|nr:hypothetical protein [Jatrophihabitans sp.]
MIAYPPTAAPTARSTTSATRSQVRQVVGTGERTMRQTSGESTAGDHRHASVPTEGDAAVEFDVLIEIP